MLINLLKEKKIKMKINKINLQFHYVIHKIDKV